MGLQKALMENPLKKESRTRGLKTNSKNHKPENNDVSHYRLYTVYENIEQTFYTLYK